ncbi:hypothetical protein ACQYWY_21655 [Comamonas sediminis]|uniref:hypothetical protein n=1 Tax=Comamonas sediminis TaxID=1783360 RepID=UPI003D2BA748
MSKTHWKRLINPDYIGAYSLEEGQDLTVVIESVRRDVVTGTGGKKEECTIAYLKGQKPFILNNTNSKSIAKLYGPYIEDWSGKPITLFASTTKLAGDTVECLRIRPVVAKRQKQGISDERLTAAIAKIKAGEYSIEKLRTQFALTRDQQEWLNAETTATVQA